MAKYLEQERYNETLTLLKKYLDTYKQNKIKAGNLIEIKTDNTATDGSYLVSVTDVLSDAETYSEINSYYSKAISYIGDFLATTYATKTQLANGLDNKSDKGHTHTVSEITNLSETLNSYQKTLTPGEHIKIDDSNIIKTYGIYSTSEVDTLLNAKQNTLTPGTYIEIADSKISTTGLYSGTYIESLLKNKSDVNHHHAISYITGLQSKLDEKQPNLKSENAGSYIKISNETGVLKISTYNIYSISEVNDAIAKNVSAVYKYKGSYELYANLPTTATIGDVYDVQETGMNYAWNGTGWDALGPNTQLDSINTTLSTYNTRITELENFKYQTSVMSQDDVLSGFNAAFGTNYVQSDLQ